MSAHYNHAFALGFSFETADREGVCLHDAAGVRRAILRRLASLDDIELIEAIGCPEDTYEIVDPAPAGAPQDGGAQ